MDIPKQQLRWVVDRMHVGKSDDQVRAEIRRRVAAHPGWTQKLIAKAEQYALQVHHENQKMYAYVMSGSAGRARNPKTKRHRWSIWKEMDYLEKDWSKERRKTKTRTASYRPGRRTRSRRAKNPFHSPATSSISAYISMGDRVTFVDHRGSRRTGRAVMRGPAGWVLNMGGRHGTPQVVRDSDIVKVVTRR